MKLVTPLTEMIKFIPAVVGIHFDQRPHPTVLETGDIEIRRYPEMTLLTCREDGTHEWAVNKAFARLAKFIFSHDIAMTIPVFQHLEDDGVTLSFFIPEDVDLPPIPEGCHVERTPERTMAVYQYSGLNYPTAMKDAEKILKGILSERSDLVIVKDVPIFAQYDAPSTIPFLRTNEVMIEVEQKV